MKSKVVIMPQKQLDTEALRIASETKATVIQLEKHITSRLDSGSRDMKDLGKDIKDLVQKISDLSVSFQASNKQLLVWIIAILSAALGVDNFLLP